MRTLVISALLALAAAPVGGCQVFTAGEAASEPDPNAARAARNKPQPQEKKPAKVASPHGPYGAAPRELATASHILVQYKGAARANPSITRSKEEARKRALEIQAKASAPGADFAALAKEYSDGPSGPRGGKLGTFPKGRMVPAFDTAVFGMKPGEVSGLVETPFGYHIIYRDK